MCHASQGNLSQKVVRYKRRRELLDERVVWVYCIMILEALHFVHAQKRPHQGTSTTYHMYLHHSMYKRERGGR